MRIWKVKFYKVAGGVTIYHENGKWGFLVRRSWPFVQKGWFLPF